MATIGVVDTSHWLFGRDACSNVYGARVSDATCAPSDTLCCVQAGQKYPSCQQYLGKGWCCAGGSSTDSCYVDQRSVCNETDSVPCTNLAKGTKQACCPSQTKCDPNVNATESEVRCHMPYGNLKALAASKSTTSTSSTSTSSLSPTSTGSSSSSSSSGPSALAGIVVGVIVGVLLIAAIALFFFRRRRRRAVQEPHSQVAYDSHTGHTETAELDSRRGGHELDGDSNTAKDYSDQNDERGKIVYGGPSPLLSAQHQSRQHQGLYEMESTGGDGRNNPDHSQAVELDGSSPSLP